MASSLQPKLYVLQYDYVADVVEKRKPHRENHLALINKQVEQGNVVLGGAVGTPPTSALIIFRNLTPDQIEQFTREDPYVVNGIVQSVSIKPYIAVVGDDLLKNDLLKV